MGILNDIDAFLSPLLPAYPAERVASVAGSIGEEVLWSGPMAGPEAVAAYLRGAAALWVLSAVLLVVGLVAGWRWLRDKDRVHAGWVALIGIGCALLNLTFAQGQIDRAAKGSGQGIVVTERRVVLLEGDARRQDTPASEIKSIVRNGADVTLHFRGVSPVDFEVRGERRANLDRALDRFAEASFRGSDALDARLGRP